MTKRLLMAAAFVLYGMALCGDAELTGDVVVSHAGYEDYVFTHTYIYVEELDAHYPVDQDGAFEVSFNEEGEYVIQVISPGFIVVRMPVRVPRDGELTVELELQVIEITVRVVQEIPDYIINLRESMTSIITADSSSLSDTQYHGLLQESIKGDSGPFIDFGKIIDFFREQIEKQAEDK